MNKPKEFRPTPIKCRQCGDIIQSKYPGQFVWCSCGETGVDQTEYYKRIIGNIEKIDLNPKV